MDFNQQKDKIFKFVAHSNLQCLLVLLEIDKQIDHVLVRNELNALGLNEYYADYVAQLDDGSYLVIEFLSTVCNNFQLVKSNMYSLILSYKTRKKVETLIVLSDDDEYHRFKLENESYTLHPLIGKLFEQNGDIKLNNIRNKINNNQNLTKLERVTLIFIPLMKSEKSTKELIIETIDLANDIKQIVNQDKTYMDKDELNEIKICQTLFVDMYFDDDKEKQEELMEAIDMEHQLFYYIAKRTYDDGYDEGVDEATRNHIRNMKEEGLDDELIERIIRKKQ